MDSSILNVYTVTIFGNSRYAALFTEDRSTERMVS